jgi:hypothetical protein
MDSRELTDKEIETLLAPLRPIEVGPTSAAYSPSLPAKTDYETRLKTAEKLQELGHKDQLMETVGYLAKESFKLLALLVVAQMIIRLFMPDYQGISDDKKGK